MAHVTHTLASIVLVLMALCYGAHAVRIINPMVNGYALDWCREYARDCGEPAASEFCRSKGYPGGATGFSEAKRLAGGRTRIITNGAICDTRYHVCDTFSWIDCGPATQNFPAPTFKGQPLDYCLNFETNCGQAAADAFCTSQGYKNSPVWKSRRLAAGTTLTIGDSAMCDTTQHVCDTFSWIICSN